MCFFSSSGPGAILLLLLLHIPHIPLVACLLACLLHNPDTMITTAKKSSNGPWVSKPTAHRVLDVVHYAYPILLLVFFIAAFTARTILAAKAATASEQKPTKVQFGPGGKPLPVRSHSYKQTPLLDFSRSRKLVFQWLSVFLCLTFAGNATIVCVQALFKRHEGWWCGQAMTVSRS